MRVSQPIPASGITGEFCIYCGRGAVLPAYRAYTYFGGKDVTQIRVALEIICVRAQIRSARPDIIDSEPLRCRAASPLATDPAEDNMPCMPDSQALQTRPAAIVLPSHMSSYARDMLFAGLF